MGIGVKPLQLLAKTRKSIDGLIGDRCKAMILSRIVLLVPMASIDLRLSDTTETWDHTARVKNLVVHKKTGHFVQTQFAAQFSQDWGRVSLSKWRKLQS
jgi:hypothetical protein